MKQGLRTFLAGIVDYAGLFPPAELELAPAIANYLAYRRGAESWMLGRFVCPVGRLGALGSALDAEGSRAEPVPVCAIARPFGTLSEIGGQLHEDLVIMHALHERTGGRAVVECVELRAPLQAGTSRESAREAVDRVALQIVETGTRARGPESPLLETYVEPANGSRLGTAVSFLVEALSGRPGLGFKLRCGGQSAESVPPTSAVAHALAACRGRGVPFKATAGLHHPIRHHDAGLGVMAHGFLNVFGAGLLAHAHGLAEADLQKILEDQAAGSLVFDDDGFQWRAHQIGNEPMRKLRERWITSFGSCSFEEPVQDLRELGLL